MSYLFSSAGLFGMVLILLLPMEMSFVEETDECCNSDSLSFCLMKYFDRIEIFSPSFSDANLSILIPLHKIRNIVTHTYVWHNGKGICLSDPECYGI